MLYLSYDVRSHVGEYCNGITIHRSMNMHQNSKSLLCSVVFTLYGNN